MKFIKKIPMAISGVSLALASLGNLLLPYGESVRYVCGILSVIILALFILKVFLDFEHAKAELNNPVVLSVLPTSTMSVMILCTYLKPFAGGAAVVIWYVAISIHILIMLLFAKRFILNFKRENVFPSWFVVCVGIVVVSVTCPSMGAKALGQVIFYIGIAFYLIILPVVICRMIKAKRFPEPVRPTIAILTAPTNLCIVGYLSAFEHPNTLFVYIMLAIAVIAYIYVSVNMIFLLRLKFYPTYAAFTFPYVISATSFKLSHAILMQNGLNFFYFVPKVSEWIAIAVVAYVLIRYAIFLFSAPEKA